MPIKDSDKKKLNRPVSIVLALILTILAPVMLFTPIILGVMITAALHLAGGFCFLFILSLAVIFWPIGSGIYVTNGEKIIELWEHGLNKEGDLYE